ncbi:hypothetical protein FGU65_03155 [Methanoculleus sp. FWC-SCC1]|uniref:Uncharacterized protein n=1 Tax=Methanoculleus frigidifontis TaxID=2584085 RepID=A0ABT8M7M8_9EURY|nr:hypothetical protein [Methanoculleus sp. FWC-SCC1]MDN7023899.1 hypothetical protein [Methanoculleus sp. FWC-SCC1]
MPYRWNDKTDVDEAIVVVMNTMDQNQEIKGWLTRTIQQAVNDSPPELSQYFFREIERHRPQALIYFQKPTY